MSEENVQLVQQALERFAATGEPPWELLHDGDYRGHEGFGRWLEDWAAAWAEYVMEPEDFLDSGERVIVFVVQKTTGHESGVSLERHDAMVFEIRDAKIARLDYFNSRGQALDAVGLAE